MPQADLMYIITTTNVLVILLIISYGICSVCYNTTVNSLLTMEKKIIYLTLLSLIKKNVG